MNHSDKTVRVWDPLVRIGHWTLVLSFSIAYFTEDDFLTQHVWAGYVVGTVVCIRLIWGFVGSKYARFSDFVRSPAATIRHLADFKQRRAKRYIGHNPAGGAMIVVLLIGLFGSMFSGMMLYAYEENAGPLAGWVAENNKSSVLPAIIATARADDDDNEHRENDAGEEFWEEVHEFFANLMVLLIMLHVAGVLISSYVEKENLVKAMITGRKRVD